MPVIVAPSAKETLNHWLDVTMRPVAGPVVILSMGRVRRAQQGMDCAVFLRRWRSWVRPLLIAIYTVVLVVALPLLIYALNVNHAQPHTQAWLIGGIFVVLAIPISVWGILQHLIHYTQPFLQRHIIRILWMVPVYAMDAWLALRFKEAAIYLDTLRECYEAYVVYNFMAYLLSFLTSRYPDLDAEIAAKPQIKHFIPFCCLPSWEMGRHLIQYCKHGVLQYTVVRPVTTCVALICQMAGAYNEGDFNFKSAWIYLATINNISQIWAMYCLVLFYFATKEELASLKPVSKFMCIKAVVFLTFWQSVLIAGLVKIGVIRTDNTGGFYTVGDIATGLQDFIICIEMFLAAIAHYFSFSHKPYMEPDAVQANCFQSFMDMWDVSDVRADVVEHVRHVGKTVTRTLRRGQAGETERTPLLQDGSNSTDGYAARSLADFADVQMGIDPATSDRQAAPRGSISTMDSTEVSLADTLSRRSFTASMNNYVEFNESVEVHAPPDLDETNPKHVISNSNIQCPRLHSPDLLGTDIPSEEVKDTECAAILQPVICERAHNVSNLSPREEGQNHVSDKPVSMQDSTGPSRVSMEDTPACSAAVSCEARAHVSVQEGHIHKLDDNLHADDISIEDPFKDGDPVYESKNDGKGDIC